MLKSSTTSPPNWACIGSKPELSPLQTTLRSLVDVLLKTDPRGL